jgi:methyl-accepting chemotaxis protein/aerotaxis receptor
MRVNEPITNQEILLPEGEMLVSRTDPGGRITFCNHAFAEVSGFTGEELAGAPHNIVRHPHMPKEAFADLWATIKAGRPWEGLVKNRAKAGGFYWVRANVTPVIEKGEVSGYISIRTQPERAAVAAAEAAYAAMRDGASKGLALRDGEVVRTGWQSRLRDAAHSLTGRIAAGAVAAGLALVLVGAVTLDGMRNSGASLRSIYLDRSVPVAELGEILDIMHASTRHASRAASALAGGAAAEVPGRLQTVRDGNARADALWAKVRATEMTPAERAAAEQFEAARGRMLSEGLAPLSRPAGGGQWGGGAGEPALRTGRRDAACPRGAARADRGQDADGA